MNRSLPPGDRGHRGSDPCGKSGRGGAVPGTVGLVGRVAAHQTGNGSESRKARRGRSRAGNGRGGRTLAADRVDSRAIVTLGRLDLQAHLLAQSAGDKTAHRVSLPTGSLYQLGQRGPRGLPQQGDDLGLFAAVPRAGSGLFAALRGLLAAGGLPARLRLGRCNVGLLCRRGGLLRRLLGRLPPVPGSAPRSGLPRSWKS